MSIDVRNYIVAYDNFLALLQRYVIFNHVKNTIELYQSVEAMKNASFS